MSNLPNIERRLSELSAPKRNRYYYGKLMDVLQFQMEQTYSTRKRQLLNRLALGKGVLCGLNVVADKKNPNHVVVEAGIAIDGLGQEIIVPSPVSVELARVVARPIPPGTKGPIVETPVPTDTLKVTGELGQTVKGADPVTTSRTIALCLEYSECLTDYAPVLVESCGSQQDCEAGTVVESYRVILLDDWKSPTRPDICASLSSQPDDKGTTPVGGLLSALKSLEQNPPQSADQPGSAPVVAEGHLSSLGNPVANKGDLQTPSNLYPVTVRDPHRDAVTALVSENCPVPEEAGCVCLALITLNADGEIASIDTETCRPVVASNALLLELVLCLAKRLDECCPSRSQASLELSKTADISSFSKVGDVITYTLAATNKGATTLSNVQITDSGLTLSCTPTQPATLAPGASLTCTVNYTATQADLDAGVSRNTASATGRDPGGQPVAAPAVTTTVTAVQRPHLTLKKDASPATYSKVGDVVRYDLVVANAGNITLTDLQFSDPVLGQLTYTQHVTLRPGDTLSASGIHTITSADVTLGLFKNSATVTGTDPHGQPVSAQADRAVTLQQSVPDTFRITSVELIGTPTSSVAMSTLAALDSKADMQPDPVQKKTVGTVRCIEITFNRQWDPATVQAASHPLNKTDPTNDYSVLVQADWSPCPENYVPGQITNVPTDANTARFVPSPEYPLSKNGTYTIILFGDVSNRPGKHLCIADRAGVRLDGDAGHVPSGDGTEGGIFKFGFTVSD